MGLPEDYLDLLVGALEAPKPYTGRGHALQGVRALAFAYADPASPLRGSEAVENALRGTWEAIRAQCPSEQRLLFHLCEAVRLAGRELFPGFDGHVAESAAVLAEELERLRPLRHWTSANIGRGTNHTAIYANAVWAAGDLLERPEWRELGEEITEKLVRAQHPDGYWEETTGGPTTLYNHLTMCAVGRMAVLAGRDDFRKSALRAARFHADWVYPDGTHVETIDGRCRYHGTPMLWGGFVFSWTAPGRALARRKFEAYRARAHGGSGELLALVAEDYSLWESGPEAALTCDLPSYARSISGPAVLRRENGWVAVLQGFAVMPRPGARFTIDRHSHLSVWKEGAGLVVNGSGAKGQPEAGSFLFPADGWDPPGVIESGRIDGHEMLLSAEYRGATCELQVVFGEDLCLRARAFVRRDRYPVTWALQLELDPGDEVELDSGSVKLDAGSKIERRTRRVRAPGRGWELSAPEGTTFLWPHDPYNPYTEDRKSSPGMYVALLKVPLGDEGWRTVRIR